jgi:hypothetical protein
MAAAFAVYGACVLVRKSTRLILRPLWVLLVVITGACMAHLLGWPRVNYEGMELSSEGGLIGLHLGSTFVGAIGQFGAFMLFGLLYLFALVLMLGFSPLQVIAGAQRAFGAALRWFAPGSSRRTAPVSGPMGTRAGGFVERPRRGRRNGSPAKPFWGSQQPASNEDDPSDDMRGGEFTDADSENAEEHRAMPPLRTRSRAAGLNRSNGAANAGSEGGRNGRPRTTNDLNPESDGAGRSGMDG